MLIVKTYTLSAISWLAKVFSDITSADDISLLKEVVTFMLLNSYASRKLPKCRGKIVWAFKSRLRTIYPIPSAMKSSVIDLIGCVLAGFVSCMAKKFVGLVGD